MTPDFDPAPLMAHLTALYGPAPMRLERIMGGQSNPTYFLGWGARDMVLRKQPAGPILAGAHAVDREFRVMAALHPLGVPVPRPLHFCADPQVIGTPFYLMERVAGRVFPDAALPQADPAERRALWTGLAQALAALHAVDPAAAGLADFGRPGDYYARQTARWTRQWQASGAGPIPDLDRLADWLAAHLPEPDDRVSIAHGDFRMGNVMFHPTEPRVVAILDWELATLGHPLADVAFAGLAWHTGPDEYGGLLGRDRAALGLPEEAGFVAAWRKALPGAPAPGPFHTAFALFRFAVIWAGIADRATAGTANDPATAARAARLARALAARGAAVIDAAPGP